MPSKPETIVNVTIKEYNFNTKQLKGLVEASDFEWDFIWHFSKGKLFVNPPLGRALIEDSLLRFLINKDYELESGGNYKFTISSKF
tara:strand:+ start:1161 stop:1418 length:258 start_codon:yes stop_codon:yes gene_type:complete